MKLPINTSTIKRKSILIFFIFSFGITLNINAQIKDCIDIIGIWVEEQDVISAMLGKPNIYRFYEESIVEVYQFNPQIDDYALLGSGNYKIDTENNSSKIVFSNLTVLIFESEGSFAFPIIDFDFSVLQWQGIFGIQTTLRKVILKFDSQISGIPVIAQPNKTTCWATVATMMYLWKNGKNTGSQSDISVTLEKHDWTMSKYYEYLGLGALPSALQSFLGEDMGMTSYTKCSTAWYDFTKIRKLPWPFNWDDGLINYTTCQQCIKPIPTIQELQELICKNGPLVWTYKKGSGHVVIINGIKNDESDYGAILSITDPWAFDRKQIYDLPYVQFYNTVIETLDDDCDYYNIYHW